MQQGKKRKLKGIKIRMKKVKRLFVGDKIADAENPLESIIRINKWAGAVAHTCNPNTGRLRQEDHLNLGGGGCRSWDCATALHPGQQSETPSQKEKQKSIFQ